MAGKKAHAQDPETHNLRINTDIPFQAWRRLEYATECLRKDLHIHKAKVIDVIVRLAMEHLEDPPEPERELSPPEDDRRPTRSERANARIGATAA